MFRTEPNQPVVVSYGLGLDSTAMLFGMHDRGIRPDVILFADVGNERDETYAYLPVIQTWLEWVGFPAVTVVKYQPKRFKYQPYTTLAGNSVANSTLPSLAFNRKSCSQKWKVAPMDAYVERELDLTMDWLASGRKVIRCIGYDDGAKDSRRGGTMSKTESYDYRYPLRDWHWDREECRHQIRSRGLPGWDDDPPMEWLESGGIPCKSACTFCPATQKHELVWLAEQHPDQAAEALCMEDRARPNLQVIDGLWGRGIKGTRKPESRRPGSWRKFLEDEGLLGDVESYIDPETGLAVRLRM